MKASHIPLHTVICILMFSPLMGQKSIYSFPFENDFRLPSMDTRIDQDEISATYQTMGNLYTTQITGIGEDKMEQTSVSFIPDTRVVDAVRLLQFYMEEQLIAPGDETSGMVEMSIIYFHERNRFSIGSALGVLTIGIGTLCGIPFSTTVTDVEIKATFYDADNQLVSVHRGVGRGRKPMSIFSVSTRKAHQKALRKALQELNAGIMGDSILMAVQLPRYTHP